MLSINKQQLHEENLKMTSKIKIENAIFTQIMFEIPQTVCLTSMHKK